MSNTSNAATVDISQHIKNIVSAGKEYTEGATDARAQVLEICHAIISELQNPCENLLRMLWAEPTHHAVVRTAVDVELFHALLGPRSSADVANACNPKVEPALMHRMLRHLAAMGTVKETGADLFAPTAFSRRLAEGHYEDSIKVIMDELNLTHVRTAEYFKQRGYHTPIDAKDTPFTFSKDCAGTHVFDWMNQHPEVAMRFGSMMRAFGELSDRWFVDNYYPVRERLIKGAKQGEVFVVDVGGGRGHDVMGLKAKFGDEIPGECILQDQPQVVAAAQLPPGVKGMAHDFNTEQVVKGARAYYIHQVLEDWSDEEVVHILRQLVPAMDREYSKLLLNQFILPERDASWILTSADWQLMGALNSRQHTETELQRFIKKAGFKITGKWMNPTGIRDGVIECELA